MYGILYTRAVDEPKDIWWEGSSLDDLIALPKNAVRDMGYQLHLVQTGQQPDDWKPLGHLGKGITGVYEIRLSLDSNIYRTAYVAKFGDVVAVLHCWQKKTQATAQNDKELIVRRYRSVKERFG